MGNDTLDTKLFRIDPTQNMARFYSMTIQPNLFGGLSLVRNWGRIGSAGQMRVDLFHDEKEARAARDLLLTTKMERGYARL
ncbi:WGR domain-containing protein [Roseobacter litoralis]|uniref:WGR domain-containing protein n=1 Tax=Roseobacter litoralis TaxID=42443 RepID=UPI0024928CB4|nr:WGR domain-containing protein [Roseobacter litoralis]